MAPISSVDGSPRRIEQICTECGLARRRSNSFVDFLVANRSNAPVSKFYEVGEGSRWRGAPWCSDRFGFAVGVAGLQPLGLEITGPG
jgi:hypothetical protein